MPKYTLAASLCFNLFMLVMFHLEGDLFNRTIQDAMNGNAVFWQLQAFCKGEFAP